MNAEGKKVTKARIINHLVFWLFCTAVITSSFTIAGLNYPTAFSVICMFLPIHLFYYYSVSYILIPKYLFHKKYTSFIFSFVVIAILCAFLFRTTEIFVSDPYILKKMLLENPSYQWHKLDGSILQQYLKPVYIVNAFEQSNQLVWVAISLKFFVLWRADKQASLQAELNFLKSQIHPHFLFNTLNNIYALTLRQSEKSPVLVLKLSEILRYMLYECDTNRVELKKDIAVLESYINVERFRYDEKRLDINLTIDGDFTGLFIPPLLMLAFVENAFKHGASEMPDNAWINIEIKTSGNKLKLKVSNSKPVNTINTPEETSGIGLKNVKKRLELCCKNAYRLKIIDEEELFAVVFELDLYREA